MNKIILLSLFLITGCSLAPFSSNKSGRSYGPGNSQVELGNANSSYYLKMGFGASPNLDIGYVMEFGGFSTSGLFLKYSLVNKEIGSSHALETGFGGGDSSTYYYGGLISSYMFTEFFELFLNPRIVSVETDEQDVELGETVGNVTVTDYDLSYVYISAGMNIWFSKSFGLSLYTIYTRGDGLETEEDFSNAGTLMLKI
jgi:hypothetical protein